MPSSEDKSISQISAIELADEDAGPLGLYRVWDNKNKKFNRGNGRFTKRSFKDVEKGNRE